jgi:3-phenylpropionate/cinnamic acid dioxygenase small subunit
MRSEAETMLIEHACERLLLRSIRTFDERDWQGFADVFAKEGVFVRANQPNDPLVGREAILVALKSRPADRLTRHLCTNIQIDVIDSDHAKGLCYLSLFSATATPPEKAIGGPADPVQRLGEYSDEYVRTADGWRIARRVGIIVLQMGEKKA